MALGYKRPMKEYTQILGARVAPEVRERFDAVRERYPHMTKSTLLRVALEIGIRRLDLVGLDEALGVKPAKKGGG